MSTIKIRRRPQGARTQLCAVPLRPSCASRRFATGPFFRSDNTFGIRLQNKQDAIFCSPRGAISFPDVFRPNVCRKFGHLSHVLAPFWFVHHISCSYKSGIRMTHILWKPRAPRILNENCFALSSSDRIRVGFVLMERSLSVHDARKQTSNKENGQQQKRKTRMERRGCANSNAKQNTHKPFEGL